MESTSDISPEELKRRVKDLALEVGFELAGVAAPDPIEPANDKLDGWIARQMHGRMDYMKRHAELRKNPQRLWPPTRSILMLALNYKTEHPTDHDPDRDGIISIYALGRDYHKVIRRMARRLLREVEQMLNRSLQSRICVDSAPLMERAYAARAGLGWIGKNTCLIHPKLGSYLFLSGILWDLELPPDEPMGDHCGKCRACLDACPTNAFTQPGTLDARRCISYHTIELRGEIPREYHDAIGTRIFGCDVCQEVCPFNRRSPQTRQPEFQTRENIRDKTLLEFKKMTADEFDEVFRGSAVRRARYDGFQRNVSIALHNTLQKSAQ